MPSTTLFSGKKKCHVLPLTRQKSSKSRLNLHSIPHIPNLPTPRRTRLSTIPRRPRPQDRPSLPKRSRRRPQTISHPLPNLHRKAIHPPTATTIPNRNTDTTKSTQHRLQSGAEERLFFRWHFDEFERVTGYFLDSAGKGGGALYCVGVE